MKANNKCLVQKNLLMNTLQPLVQEKAISADTAIKVASSGLGLHHLQLEFERGGADGLELLLKERFGGKPCVTANKRTVQHCKLFCFKILRYKHKKVID